MDPKIQHTDLHPITATITTDQNILATLTGTGTAEIALRLLIGAKLGRWWSRNKDKLSAIENITITLTINPVGTSHINVINALEQLKHSLPDLKIDHTSPPPHKWRPG